MAFLPLYVIRNKKKWVPPSCSWLRPPFPTIFRPATLCSLALVKMELVRLSLRGASWLLHNGDKLSLFVANPFGLLSVPKSHRHTPGTSIRWTQYWRWQHGAHVLRQIPNGTAPFSGHPRIEVSPAGRELVPWPSSGTWGLTQPWDAVWAAMQAAGESDSSKEVGRATAESFFLAQVKCP